MFDSIISKVVLGVIRHAISTFGGGLVAHGLLTQDQNNQVIGALMVIVPIAFSAWDKWQAQSKLNAAKGN